MILSIKRSILLFAFRVKAPLLTFYIIRYFSKKNIYISRNFLGQDLLNLLRKLKGYIQINITGTGLLILFYKEYIVKIPLGDASKESLRKDFKNYLLIKKSIFKDLVNYKLEYIDGYYKMDRLANVKNIDLKFVLDKFYRKTKILTFEDICKNKTIDIDLLQKEYKIEIRIPLNTKIESIVMHGDLTQNNIMQNKDKLVLIDLDRFTFTGVKNIDRIHYIIDKESKRQGISFFEYIINLINNTKEYKLIDLYIYFLYRISNEYKHGIQLDASYYKDIQNVNYLFKKGFSKCTY